MQCKKCGGEIIRLEGKTYGICDSCGREDTCSGTNVPKMVEMYNKGNYFRRMGEFDRAYSAYEHIVAENQGDAEAYWCLTLCRYGIEYVLDKRKNEYKPTMNRMSYELILDDPHYKRAMEASDDKAKAIYQKEAEHIAVIQKKYRDIYKNEPAYDVFICFKAEEDDGQRTKGSIIAQDIYTELTNQGLNVFFSRITLEDKLGEDYEPYIFAALHSAKVMLLVANKPAHLQSRWVKNEWTRYLGMMEHDGNKSLVPVYIDMSPYDFPEEIPTAQAQDMSKVGSMQDLTRGVLKLTGKLGISPEPAGNVKDNLMKRLYMALEDSDFKEAEELTKRMLDYMPEDGEAYYYLLLASNESKSCAELLDRGCDWPENRYFKRAVQYGTEVRKKELAKLAEDCELESRYRQAKQKFQDGKKLEAIDIYRSLNGYRNCKELIHKCEQALKTEIEYRKKENQCDLLKKTVSEINSTSTWIKIWNVVISFCACLISLEYWAEENPENILLWSMIMIALVWTRFGKSVWTWWKNTLIGERIRLSRRWFRFVVWLIASLFLCAATICAKDRISAGFVCVVMIASSGASCALMIRNLVISTRYKRLLQEMRACEEDVRTLGTKLTQEESYINFL